MDWNNGMLELWNNEMKLLRNFNMLSLVVLFCCSCNEKLPEKFVPKLGAKKVKIGVIAPLSGKTKTQGEQGIKGIKSAMYVDPAMPNGDWVELIVEDDQDIPENTVKAFTKLAEQDKVKAVLVMSSSKSVLALNPLVDKFQTPVLALVASHPDITVDVEFMNQVCFDNEFQGQVAALYARDELLIGKVAVFVNNENPHSKSLADIFKKKFTEVEGEVVVTFPVDTEMATLKDSLEFLKKNDVEMLYMPIHAGRFIEVSKALNKMGWHPIRMGSDGLLSDVFDKYKHDSGLMEGVLGVDFYSSNAPYTEKGKLLQRVYRHLYPEKGSTYVVAGTEGYQILFAGMSQCRDFTDRIEVNREIRQITDLKGVMGRISITSKGKAQRPLYVNTIEHGKLKFLVKVY